MAFPRIKWKFDLINKLQNIPQAEISQELKISASRTWNLEDCSHLPNKYRHSGWEYSVERFGEKSIEEVFSALKLTLLPVLNQLRHLIDCYNLEVQFVCVIEAVDGDGPEVILESDAMKFIADLNARLCFDLYYVNEEQDTGTVLLS